MILLVEALELAKQFWLLQASSQLLGDLLENLMVALVIGITKNLDMDRPYLLAIEDLVIENVEIQNSIGMAHHLMVPLRLVHLVNSQAYQIIRHLSADILHKCD